MILEQIAASTKQRIAELKKITPLPQMKLQAQQREVCTGYPLEQALKRERISFICEVKKASPSKGIIAEEFPYITIAKEYEAAGAAAISVLTEPTFFLGKNQYLTEIVHEVGIPVLRKDFILDAYQIYESKVLGADAVLLICALLEQETLVEFLSLSHELGMSALVEAHTEEEVARAVEAGARIIGVNNRDLSTFKVDVTTSIRLREKVPASILFVSESGIRTKEDIARLEKNHANAVLIGETLMRAEDKKEAIRLLKGEG